MMNKCFLLQNELQALSLGLSKGNKLLLKPVDKALKCSFVMGGLVQHVVLISNSSLCQALLQKSVAGILEGAYYTTFKSDFAAMALHLKAQELYEDLLSEQTAFSGDYQKAAVA